MPFTVKSLSCVSLLQFLLGILAFILGLLSIKDSSLYNGVFGMGLWIGGWMIVTALAGFLTSRHPGDHCKVGLFIGSCLVAIFPLSICTIILGIVVTTSSGSEGMEVFGFLLLIQISDILVCCCSIHKCRDLCQTQEEENNVPSARRDVSTQRSAGNAIPDVPSVTLALDGNNWAEHGFPSSPQTTQYIDYYSSCKLPNYEELYPEGIANTGQDRLELESRPSDEPPPEYTPVVAPSPKLTSLLPGTSVYLPSTPSNLLAVDRVFEHSRARLASSLLNSGPPPEYPGTLRLPTLAPPLHPGDLFGPSLPHVTPSDSASSESETHTGDAECLERDLPSCSTLLSVSRRNLPSEVRTLPNTVTRS